MAKRRLPIGIQSFRMLREENCYYVDKTAFIERLVAEGTRYFLSRPRRFGKSLLVDTMKELFEGGEKLFEGLRVHAGWTWGEPNPVVRLDFAGGDYRQPNLLEDSLMDLLAAEERRHEVETNSRTVPGRFAHLLEVLHKRTGRRVVVLVDEYDKPILDMLGTPSVACANRDLLRNVYGVIKANDARVRFAFLTGVSKFSKVNLFSQLNNLIDITLEPAYSSICGYTERDLDTVFAPELEGLDRDEVRDWYNGYSWLGEEKVYNPFDVLLLLRRRTFDAHWFETGSPAFLVETLFKRRVSSVSLEEMEGTERLLSAFDVEHISTEALLFQTGYLTITEMKRGRRAVYRLGYPNREVRQSLNEHLLLHLVPDDARQMANSTRLERLLETADCAGLRELFHAFFASIPYEWHTNNDIANYEGYYASVFYSYFAASGYDIVVEESSAAGRLDMAVRTGGHVYLFEFKVVEQAGAGAALAQLRERGYAAKYRGRNETIHLIGVEFSRKTRTLAAFEAADA